MCVSAGFIRQSKIVSQKMSHNILIGRKQVKALDTKWH